MKTWYLIQILSWWLPPTGLLNRIRSQLGSHTAVGSSHSLRPLIRAVINSSYVGVEFHLSTSSLQIALFPRGMFLSHPFDCSSKVAGFRNCRSEDIRTPLCLALDHTQPLWTDDSVWTYNDSVLSRLEVARWNVRKSGVRPQPPRYLRRNASWFKLTVQVCVFYITVTYRRNFVTCGKRIFWHHILSLHFAVSIMGRKASDFQDYTTINKNFRK